MSEILKKHRCKENYSPDMYKIKLLEDGNWYFYLFFRGLVRWRIQIMYCPFCGKNDKELKDE